MAKEKPIEVKKGEWSFKGYTIKWADPKSGKRYVVLNHSKQTVGNGNAFIQAMNLCK